MSDSSAASAFESFALSDIAHIEMGQAPDSRYVVEDPFQGRPFLQGNAEFGAVYPKPKFGCLHPAKMCEANDVLISVRAPVGAINIADCDYCIGRGLAAIRVRGMKPSLLGEVIARQSPLLRRVAQGTTFEAITKSDLLSLAFRLPPKTEWPAIAEILDTCDAVIQKTEALIDNLKAIKQGLLHDLLTRGIDANGQLRPRQTEAPHLYKQSPLGWLPKEWGFVQVRNAGGVKLGRQRSPSHERGLHMRPYLRVANVFDGYIDYSDVMEMNFSPAEQQTFSVLPGDILLNEGQSLELVGRCAIYEGPPQAFCFQNTLVRFRASESTAPAFARHVFKYWLDTGRFAQVAKQTTSVAHLGADRFADMMFPTPTRKEQEQIVDRMRAAIQMIEMETAQLAKLKQEKSALMDDLLTGRVRVTPLLRPIPA